MKISESVYSWCFLGAISSCFCFCSCLYRIVDRCVRWSVCGVVIFITSSTMAHCLECHSNTVSSTHCRADDRACCDEMVPSTRADALSRRSLHLCSGHVVLRMHIGRDAWEVCGQCNTMLCYMIWYNMVDGMLGRCVGNTILCNTIWHDMMCITVVHWWVSSVKEINRLTVLMLCLRIWIIYQNACSTLFGHFYFNTTELCWSPENM